MIIHYKRGRQDVTAGGRRLETRAACARTHAHADSGGVAALHDGAPAAPSQPTVPRGGGGGARGGRQGGDALGPGGLLIGAGAAARGRAAIIAVQLACCINTITNNNK